MPLSRKPGFSKKSLASVLNLSGREYVHMVNLGCPKLVRDRYREDGNWKRYTEGFMKHLKAQDDAIAELSALAATSNCALLCYEADPNFCHRSMVASAVKDYCGARVTHIKASAKKASPVAALFNWLSLRRVNQTDDQPLVLEPVLIAHQEHQVFSC